jgi:hypothetical protein
VTAQAMPVELDHVFICSSPGAADCLTAFGLTEGTPNTHPGQGTACRRFFFRNAYLELLWISNPVEAQSETTRPTHLWERWNAKDELTCPFGIGFRPGSAENEKPPFATWEYRPAFLPEPLNIQVGNNCDVLTEPFLFFLPFALRRRPDTQTGSKRQPLEHGVGFREISRVELVIPHGATRSPELQSLVAGGLVRVSDGAQPLMTLGFEGEAQGKRADFRPALPLMFNW